MNGSSVSFIYFEAAFVRIRAITLPGHKSACRRKVNIICSAPWQEEENLSPVFYKLAC